VTDTERGHDPAGWATPEWRDAATAWLDRQLLAAGLARTGEVTQTRVRAWGTVLRAPTTGGPVWLKAPAPATAFEVPLCSVLARLVPDRVLAPLAADAERGWLLLPDGGPDLQVQVPADGLVDAMVAVLPQYGQLQRELAPHTGALLAAGVTDMRPATMPARFDQALAAVEDYLGYAGSGADWSAYRRVAGFRAEFGSWCDRLAGLPGPASLDHNDLHPANVLGSPGGPVRFYDWGDSVLAHPFATLLVGLGYFGNVLGAGPGDPSIVRLRDAYLEVFSDLAPHRELVEAVELACTVGKVARALVWHRALATSGYQDAGQFSRAPLEWLLALALPGYFAVGG
jgi:hypothetical protein